MSLAWFWVAAATAWLAAAGCFSPDFLPAQECAPDNRCPGDLTCVEGLCCPTTAPCGGGGPDGGDSGDSGGDSGTAFDFGPYACDADTDLLLHFDDRDAADQFRDACEKTGTTSVLMPYDIDSVFDRGITLNRGSATSRYLSASNGMLTANTTEYSIDVWVDQVAAFPSTASQLVVIASLASFMNETLLEGRFILALDHDQHVRLELFTGSTCASPLPAVVSNATVPAQGATHIRANVTQERVELFINGELDVEEMIGTPCTDLRDRNPGEDLEIRLGAISGSAGASENMKYVKLSGGLDELRISKIAREP